MLSFKEARIRFAKSQSRATSNQQFAKETFKNTPIKTIQQVINRAQTIDMLSTLFAGSQYVNRRSRYTIKAHTVLSLFSLEDELNRCIVSMLVGSMRALVTSAADSFCLRLSRVLLELPPVLLPEPVLLQTCIVFLWNSNPSQSYKH